MYLVLGWLFDCFDSMLWVIFRVFVYEFVVELEILVKVVLNEYVDICYVFFGESECKFVNVVMDVVVCYVRLEEFNEVKNGIDIE